MFCRMTYGSSLNSLSAARFVLANCWVCAGKRAELRWTMKVIAEIFWFPAGCLFVSSRYYRGDVDVTKSHALVGRFHSG